MFFSKVSIEGVCDFCMYFREIIKWWVTCVTCCTQNGAPCGNFIRVNHQIILRITTVLKQVFILHGLDSIHTCLVLLRWLVYSVSSTAVLLSIKISQGTAYSHKLYHVFVCFQRVCKILLPLQCNSTRLQRLKCDSIDS